MASPFGVNVDTKANIDPLITFVIWVVAVPLAIAYIGGAFVGWKIVEGEFWFLGVVKQAWAWLFSKFSGGHKPGETNEPDQGEYVSDTTGWRAAVADAYNLDFHGNKTGLYPERRTWRFSDSRPSGLYLPAGLDSSDIGSLEISRSAIHSGNTGHAGVWYLPPGSDWRTRVSFNGGAAQFAKRTRLTGDARALGLLAAVWHAAGKPPMGDVGMYNADSPKNHVKGAAIDLDSTLPEYRDSFNHLINVCLSQNIPVCWIGSPGNKLHQVRMGIKEYVTTGANEDRQFHLDLPTPEWACTVFKSVEWVK